MPIYKKKRFGHSQEVRKHMQDRGNAGTEYREGKRSGTYYDLGKDKHLHVKDGKIGVATNLFIVVALSTAGYLVFTFVFPLFGG